MKQKTKVLLGCIPIIFGLVGCGDGSTEPESGQALALLEDGNGSLERLFVNNSASDSLDSFWYCTILRDGAFVDRQQLYINAGGGGSLDGADIKWTVENDLIHLETDRTSSILTDTSFSERLFPADQFSARVSDGSDLRCDWSGEPRQGEIFHDESDTFPTPTVFELTRGTYLSQVLTTDNNPSLRFANWSCSSQDGLITDRLYQFHENGRLGENSEGSWSASISDQVTLSVDASATGETWNRFVFPGIVSVDLDIDLTFFTVQSDVSGSLSCSRVDP